MLLLARAHAAVVRESLPEARRLDDDVPDALHQGRQRRPELPEAWLAAVTESLPSVALHEAATTNIAAWCAPPMLML